ncbi:MAG: DUF4430 domain-containing protein, partial [Candidatus Kerfeldbacteria bacterium]|nr:DUF4430 domain-containing protein [Candidatus Kerfeldbacteria bacterium]
MIVLQARYIVAIGISTLAFLAGMGGVFSRSNILAASTTTLKESVVSENTALQSARSGESTTVVTPRRNERPTEMPPPGIVVQGTSGEATSQSVRVIPPPEANVKKGTTSAPEPIGSSELRITGPTGAQIFVIDVLPDDTVETAMRRLDEELRDFSIQWRSYGELGWMVEGFNEVNNKSGRYWTYAINGVSASLGVSSQKLQENMNIEWKY